MMSLRNLIGALVGLAFLALTGTANAVVTAEIPDAGQTLATAQTIGPTDQITGNLFDTNDVDMFWFSWGGGSLTIDTFGSGIIDTYLSLFDPVGVLLAFDDDDPGGIGNFQSSLTQNLSSGTYYIAVSEFANEPTTTLGKFVIGGTLTGWTDFGLGSGGNYLINFSGTTGAAPAAAVPEPATLAILGVGLAGLGFMMRRRRRLA